MGVMMKGIVERPIAVVIHFRTGRGHLVLLPIRWSDAAHTRLMVKPGMITEASACHTNVSTTATATRPLFPGLSPWAWRKKSKLNGGKRSPSKALWRLESISSTREKASYHSGFLPFVKSVGSDIRSGHGITAPHQTHWHQGTKSLPDLVGIACGRQEIRC